jgi:nucleotide-binding universal stress UspA family protein
VEVTVASFKKIVVPTDFSDYAASALETGLRLAGDLGASVTLVHVVPASFLRTAVAEELFASDDTDETIRAKVEAHIARRFDELVARLGPAAAAADRVVLQGDPGRAIVDYLRETGADMVVMGRRGANVREAILGSETEQVVRRAPCPVLVVRRRE